MTIAVSIWSWFGLWLILVWMFGRGLAFVPQLHDRSKLVYILAAGLALALMEVRWFGYPLSYWSSSLMANFSIVLVLLLVVSISEGVLGGRFFRARDWRAARGFGAASAFVLYPSALGLGPGDFDVYSLGWPAMGGGAALLFAIVSLVTASLFLVGNRFAWFLLAATVGYGFQFQESRNYWDYLQDPIYAGFSLLAVLFCLCRRVVKTQLKSEQ